MHRFYIPGVSVGDAWLPDDEARHARVLRMCEGDEAEVFDGQGMIYPARIVQADKSGVRVALGQGTADDQEPQTRVTLYQGVPKAGKMELIIQKCTELGIHAIVPVLTERCVVRMSGAEAQTKQTRWQRVALEAAKQCKRSYIPRIHAPAPLADARQPFLRHGLALLPWEEAREGTLKQALSVRTRDIGVLIGPEGGLAAEEVSALAQGGARVVTLGKRILRTETAGMALLAVIGFEMDELQ